MHQDFISGRESEVSLINGEIVRLAREVNMHVPLNEGMVRLVREWEAQGEPTSPCLSAEEMRERLRWCARAKRPSNIEL